MSVNPLFGDHWMQVTHFDSTTGQKPPYSRTHPLA
jgi:hypothetical protein